MITVSLEIVEIITYVMYGVVTCHSLESQFNYSATAAYLTTKDDVTTTTMSQRNGTRTSPRNSTASKDKDVALQQYIDTHGHFSLVR